ncbi:MAG: type II toxin-antitoxin system VapC family toxin [Chloroflexi bacterium]|nr:type II toxin-antitoxin system VapC family toxin [Chloroflexota bacterium]
MIVDTSAVLAILFGEEEADQFDEAIARAGRCRMSAGNLLETAIVLEGRRGAAAEHELDAYLRVAEIDVVPVTVAHAQAARRAWRRLGRGNHPARLNFGDCFAYALAESTGEPLLYKGGDFALTDIEAA